MDIRFLSLGFSAKSPHILSFLFGIVFIIAVILPAYGIYRVILWKLNLRGRMIFNRILILSGLLLGTVFFIEITLTLITEHQVNRQFGFSYATPQTPEGEPFLITRVVAGKTMDKAGLMVDDQVLMNSTVKLYRLLIESQSKVASFQVLRDNTEVTISVKVPEMKLPLRRVSFFF